VVKSKNMPVTIRFTNVGHLKSVILSVVLLFPVICCTAQQSIYISPFGNKTWFKKRTSEKDFSFSTTYDFSIEYARLGDNTFARFTEGDQKTTLEEVWVDENSMSASNYYVKKGAEYELIASWGNMVKRDSAWTYEDPEKKVQLSCKAVKTQQPFNGIQNREVFTVTKKGEGINIKEVYIEGYGLVVFVKNGAIYTQMMSPFDLKKDMMATLGYTDPMACLLVNETNYNYFEQYYQKLWATYDSTLRKTTLNEEEFAKLTMETEAFLRSLSASFYKHFGNTSGFGDPAKHFMNYCFTLLTARNFNSMDTTLLVHKQARLRAARLQTYMDNGLDYIDFDRIGGYGNKRLHDRNYCQVFNFMAKTIISPDFVYPFSIQELSLVHQYAEAARQIKKEDERWILVNQSWLLTMMGLAIAKNREGEAAADPNTRERSLSAGCKYANEFLGWVIELRNRKDTSLDKVTSPEIDFLLNMLEQDKTGTPSASDKWSCFMNFKRYPAAMVSFKTATKDYSLWGYRDYLIVEMAKALNNTDEVVELIKTGHKDSYPTDKAIVFLELNRPDAALDIIKAQTPDLLYYFCDEVGGLKVLRKAKALNQMKLLEFFYQEITSTYNLNKVPKNSYNRDTYEQMVKLSSITGELGNAELSQKLYNYYTKM
jgi:hypothetical protein